MYACELCSATIATKTYDALDDKAEGNDMITCMPCTKNFPKTVKVKIIAKRNNAALINVTTVTEEPHIAEVSYN